MNRAARLPMLALAALAAAACAGAEGAGPGTATRSGGLVHTPAPPPPEIHDDAASPRLPLAGGYTDAAPVDEADAGQKAARDLAVAEIYRRYPQRGRVESATVSTQVVAGLNYRFRIVMTGGKAYDAVVYRDLQGRMTVSSVGEAPR